MVVYPEYDHIMIVHNTNSGNATRFIHSSSYNYNKTDSKGKFLRDLIGVQSSMIDTKTYKKIIYYRFKGLN